MADIFLTDEFKNRYKELPVFIQKKAEKQEKLFRHNYFHPSLHTEKLEPKRKQIWSFRVDKKYRIFFKFEEKDKVIFLTVGPHNWIYKFKI